jgi:hypothetical protein
LVTWRRQDGRSAASGDVEPLKASADGGTPFAFELKDSDPL